MCTDNSLAFVTKSVKMITISKILVNVFSFHYLEEKNTVCTTFIILTINNTIVILIKKKFEVFSDHIFR